MIARMTDRNELTIPESIASEFEGIEYFDITKESGRLVLTPVQLTGIERVWQKIEERGITEQDIADAVKWARENK
ncbi:MAG: AbrB/MazE/SpoVT family DNA-binding domain-containing protein [Chloroflexi bacterium]|nr:AbrB/MazE/SpoVT family DNA-binding domain-containing protein [Chloroflexota bacterium]